MTKMTGVCFVVCVLTSQHGGVKLLTGVMDFFTNMEDERLKGDPNATNGTHRIETNLTLEKKNETKKGTALWKPLCVASAEQCITF